MTNIYNAAKGCTFKNRKILFDTNVWISIDGFDPGPKSKQYSDFYASALSNENDIVVSDYIIGEYFNRACRIQFDIARISDPNIGNFKKYRKTTEFSMFIESIRDTCLNMMDDCIYEPATSSGFDVKSFIAEAGTGLIDFSDIIIREHCALNGYVLVSDDSDLSQCGLDFVTANGRVLRQAGIA